MEVIFQAVVTGLVTSLFSLLPTLGIGILYRHGRYLPIWLADHGVLSVYLIHLLVTLGLSVLLGASIAIFFTTLLAFCLYRYIFVQLIEKNSPLAALLASIGIIQIYQSVISLYSSGKSQHFFQVVQSDPITRILSIPVYQIDSLALFSFLLIVCALYLFINKSHTGLQIKLILSNRKLAQHHSLPVKKLDKIALFIATLLVSLGALMKGIKYDLQPQMMFYTGMTALVSCIIAGEKRWMLAPLIVVFIEITVSLIGLYAATSSMQRSIPFLLLLVYFAIQTKGKRDYA